MKKIKVALDISPLSTGHSIRGTGFYVSELLKALQASPHEGIELITFSDKKDLPSDVDLIHVPYFDPFFIQLNIKNISKTIVTVHDLTPILLPDLFPAGVKGNIKWEINKYLLKHARGIIAPTQKTKEDLISLVGVSKDKIFVTGEGYGNQFYKVLDKKKIEKIIKKHDLPSEYILYLGDVTPNKNLPRLVRAASEAHVNLMMVGKSLTETNFDRTNVWNNDRMYVQEYSKTHKNIFLTGFIPDEELNLLFNGATAVAMISLYEGFGLPVAQAMSCGVPVVISREGSLPEIAGDAALYVDAYSEKDITDKLEEIVKEKKLRQELAIKGLKQSKKFSWVTTAYLTYNAYAKNGR